MFSSKEARKYTKENIGGKAGTILGYAILYYIFKGLISGALSSFDGVLGFLTPIVVSALLTPIHVGLFRIMTSILKNKKPSFSMLFEDYKYFVNLFVIGLAFNAAIQFGYKIYVLGVIVEYIYIGALYFFIYNSNLSIGEYFSKFFEKLKDYFGEGIILELSYCWPIALTALIYGIISVMAIVLTTVYNFDSLLNISSAEDLLTILSAFIPLVIVTILFVIAMITLTIIIVPRLLFAEAKFYSAFETENNEKKEKKNSFCPNCGSKVNGNFCESCGTKIKE